MGFGIGESLVVLAIVVLLFGGKKLPQLGSSLGKAIQNFKKGLGEEDEQSTDKDDDKKSLK
ncbi:Sec-independent protein translocase TatA [Halobacteriovorax marinus]|uniref:Sec-independent protein translocase protein TatA n=1 Tax=Halobacteriovorax marinus (strain ATCC BAA-682 / DSM 15412 / SJ) TaxID=862908 RepID=E1X3M1_HALMS|nr:twin-arginine translocase TatA/TatE family subunit [Halobacteriovorax marinus]ATH08271.1 Sec-independent protein translocase TatA [Halobacteriovorax marinus]CBW26950.1 putative Sec-independent protein translocase protein tatA/E homolog [Halobacteriovorax marinus SJ]